MPQPRPSHNGAPRTQGGNLLPLPRYIGAFRNKVDGGGYQAHLISRDPVAIEAFARRWDKPGVSVYDGVNPLLLEAMTRDKDSVAEQGVIWVDIDLRGLKASRDEVLKKLLELPLSLEIRDSGGGGFHVGAELKEAELRDTPEFERINDVRKLLIHMLSGDVNVDHHAHLLRRPGTHNTNYDVIGECRVLRPGKPVDITEAETLIELYPEPLFERRPPASKANGHAPIDSDKRSFDLEEWSAELCYPYNIHTFEVRGTASLIASGVEVDCAVDMIMEAVAAYIVRCPPSKPWNMELERRRVARMTYSWIDKHPEFAATLPNDVYANYKNILNAGDTPGLHWDRVRKTHWAYSKTPFPETPPSDGWHYYDDSTATPIKWGIKGILVDLVVTILSGQWGMFKTTIALLLSISIMTGLPFAGRYRVKRRGGVIYFAVEGGGGIKYRLKHLAAYMGVGGTNCRLFTAPDCPPLKDKKAAIEVNAIIDKAAAEMRRRWGVTPGLVVFDTWAKCSGADSKGEEDDNSVSTAVVKTLEAIVAHVGCGCLANDHMGKDRERGTRGASSKEGNVDGLLGTLGERSISGPATNLQLAIRKVKDGEAGFEIPFTQHKIVTGQDEDGDDTTAIVVDWGHPQDAPQPTKKVTKPVQLLRAAVEAAVEAEGRPLDRAGGDVMAATDDAVRPRYYALFVRRPGSTEAQHEETRKKSYQRALAEDTAGIGRRTANGVTWLWRNKGSDG